MKKILFIFILAALWFPMIQENFSLIKFNELAGVTLAQPKPELNKHNWFDASFQKDYETLHESKYGGREFFIRLYNQINFSLFRITNADIVIGKDDYLFEPGYLNERSGIYFAGKDHLNEMLKNVEEVQKYLASENILLVTLLAPGKSYYYQEYMPDFYQKRIGSETNYGEILRASKNYNINMIDANDWFLKIKDTTHLPLFPRQGIHWNYYGMAIVADSVIKYVEAKTQKNLADVKYTIDFPEPLQGTDNDLGDLLNLLFKQKNPIMPYPNFTFDTLNHPKLRLLTVGDSFYWTIFNSDVFTNVFSNMRYYYYNSSVYEPGGQRKEQPADYNMLREIKNYDVIFLIQSTPNYQNIGTGFVQLLQKNIKQRNDLSAKYTEQIKNENKYTELTTDYSRLHSVSADSSIAFIADSLAMFYMDHLSGLKFSMRSSPEWMAQLEEKAIQNSISLEVMMEMDAEWMISQEKK